MDYINNKLTTGVLGWASKAATSNNPSLMGQGRATYRTIFRSLECPAV